MRSLYSARPKIPQYSTAFHAAAYEPRSQSRSLSDKSRLRFVPDGNASGDKIVYQAARHRQNDRQKDGRTDGQRHLTDKNTRIWIRSMLYHTSAVIDVTRSVASSQSGLLDNWWHSSCWGLRSAGLRLL